MKKLIIALLPVILMLASCRKEVIVGAGNVQTEQRTVGNFTKIEVSGNTKVFITQGAVFNVEVRAYSNLLPYLETKVEGDLLKSGYRSGANINNDNSELYITMPFLNGISVYGNSDITTSGNFAGASNFNMRITGKSIVNLQQGSAENLVIDFTGIGVINAFGFSSNNAVVNLTGTGDIELTALDHLHVTLRGNGNVYYKGNPVLISNITGTGRVEKR